MHAWSSAANCFDGFYNFLCGWVKMVLRKLKIALKLVSGYRLLYRMEILNSSFMEEICHAFLTIHLHKPLVDKH